MSLAQWLGFWLEFYIKPTLRATTYERYVGLVKNHIVPALGDVLLRNCVQKKSNPFTSQKKKKAFRGEVFKSFTWFSTVP